MSKKATKTKEVLTHSEEKVDKPKIAPKVKQSLIYLGPSIPGVVRHANVFNGKLPASLEKAVSEFPIMRHLIVPVSEAATLTKELHKEQSAAVNIYAAVVKKYNL